MSEYTSKKIYANSIQIHYYHSSSPHSRFPLVLLHGLTDNGMCWIRVANALRDNFDIYMPDTRGHGLSEKPESGYSLTNRAADIAGFIDALGLDRPVVFGHSIGGQAATAVAGLYPDKVRGVVLEDPAWFENRVPAEVPNENSQRWKDDLLHYQSLSRAATIAECHQNNPTWHIDELNAWAESRYQMSPDALVSILSSMQGSWKELVSKITCPILLVTPDLKLGGIITPQMVAEASLLWKNGREAHIPGAGHSIHREQFDLYMSAVQDFLKEIL